MRSFLMRFPFTAMNRRWTSTGIRPLKVALDTNELVKRLNKAGLAPEASSTLCQLINGALVETLGGIAHTTITRDDFEKVFLLRSTFIDDTLLSRR